MKAHTTQPAGRILLLIISFSTILSFRLSAQKEIDVIYLNNGDVIRGYLVDRPDSSVVCIETLCYNTFHYNRNEIASISKELLQKRKNRPFSPKESGYENITDFGLLIASGYNEKNVIFSIMSTNNYRLSNGMAPGAGIGVEFFEQPIIPLYASYSWHFYTSKFSPFASVRAGYSFAVGTPGYWWDYTVDPSGGMMWSAGLGTTIWLSHRNALVISINYRYQGIHSERTWDWSDATVDILKKYNRLEFRFGFQF